MKTDKCTVAMVCLISVRFAHGSPLEDELAVILGANKVGVTEIAFIEHTDTTVARPLLWIDGAQHQITMWPSNPIADDVRVEVRGDLGSRLLDLPPPNTFRGRVDGWAGSSVAAFVDDRGCLTAFIDPGIPGRGWIVVHPVRNFVRGADIRLHAVAWTTDLPQIEGICAAFEDELRRPAIALRGDPPSPYDDLRVAEIAFDTDHEHYLRNGSSAQNVRDRIALIMNAVNMVYERDVAITHDVTRIVIRSSASDPYTSDTTGGLLDQFREEWNANEPSSGRDMAHMLTGTALSGPAIGTAYVGAVCDRSWAYGVSADGNAAWTLNKVVALVAHELGHNWNASHCNGSDPCQIMCSSINSCDGFGAPNFGADAIGEIDAFADTRGCLDIRPRPGTWVDFHYMGPSNGSFSQPFQSIADALGPAGSGGLIRLKPGSTADTMIINQPITIDAPLGSATIGD